MTLFEYGFLFEKYKIIILSFLKINMEEHTGMDIPEPGKAKREKK